MLVFLSLILIIFSILFFLIGYAFLNGKAEDILMWSFTGKVEKVTDREGYKKVQGKHAIAMGFIFLFVPVSLYVIPMLGINEKSLYLWLFIILIVILSNGIQGRKYFK